MEASNTNTNSQNTETQANLEDAFLAVEVIRKALEFRPYIREAVLGEKFLALSREERLNEMLTPRISFLFVDEEKKVPSLFFRFVGENSPIIEACFYPIEAVLSFLDEARGIVKNIPEKNRKRKGRFGF